MQSTDSSGDSYFISDSIKILLNEKLGSGSFGQIYKCIDINTKKEYAAKIEANSTTTPQLAHEYKILKQLEGEDGLPEPILFKNQGMDSVLVIPLYGPNLEDIMQYTKDKKFSLKTSLMIAFQMINLLSYMHDKGFIHRDLKPENICVNTNIRDTTLYLIDFGLSRKILDNKSNHHIPFKENRGVLGTVRYISINAHKGNEQGRRDDLESLFYIILYFIKGDLPWGSVKGKTKEEKYQKVMDLKIANKPEMLCKDLPVEIKLIFDYVFELEFEDRPNYNYIKSLLTKAMEKMRYKNDNQFDWMFIELLEEPVFMIREIKRKKKAKEEEEKQKLLEQQEQEKDLEHEEELTDKMEELFDERSDKSGGGSNNKINQIHKKITKEMKEVDGRRRCKGSFHGTVSTSDKKLLDNKQSQMRLSVEVKHKSKKSFNKLNSLGSNK